MSATSTPVSAVPVRTPRMERAAALSQDEWLRERLAESSVTQLLAVRGIQSGHVLALQNAGIQNLLQLRRAEQWPLLGATTDIVREWLDQVVADYLQEHAQLRRQAAKAA